MQSLRIHSDMLPVVPDFIFDERVDIQTSRREGRKSTPETQTYVKYQKVVPDERHCSVFSKKDTYCSSAPMTVPRVPRH